MPLVMLQDISEYRSHDYAAALGWMIARQLAVRLVPAIGAWIGFGFIHVRQLVPRLALWPWC